METMTVRLEAFEGPFDLLYHLIEKNQIDIYNIPIAQLTDQYLDFIHRAPEPSMESMKWNASFPELLYTTAVRLWEA